MEQVLNFQLDHVRSTPVTAHRSQKSFMSKMEKLFFKTVPRGESPTRTNEIVCSFGGEFSLCLIAYLYGVSKTREMHTLINQKIFSLAITNN